MTAYHNDAEAARVRAVDLIDVARVPTGEIETVTSLVRAAFGVAVCVVNLVGEHEERALAGVGAYAACGDRATAFCDLTVRESGCFVIEDAPRDPRFKDNPKVTSGEIGFYAGVPVYGPGGERVGALCVRDPLPRTFTQDDRRRLTQYGEVVTGLLQGALASRHAEERTRALQEIKRESGRRERVLAAFVEHTPAAVAMFDTSMRYVAASRRWMDLFAPGAASVADQPHDEVFPGMPERWRQVHHRCLAGEVITCERDRLEHLGVVQWLKWEVRPWANESGGIGGVMMLCEDVTQRVEMEEEQRIVTDRLELALQAGDLGLWDWNLTEQSAFFSDTWFTMLGYKPDEMPAYYDTWVALTHEEDRVAAEELLGKHLRGESDAYHAEFRMLHKDGRWVWIETLGRVMARDSRGDPTRMLGIHINVTERKQAEARIERYAEDTARALRRVDEQARQLTGQNRDLDEARAAAEEAVAVKTAFLANMSHELRTPMTAIIGFAEMLGSGDTPLCEQDRRFAGAIRRNGAHLLELVGDLLDLSKIEAEQLTLERVEVDLGELLREVRETLGVRATEKSLGLSCRSLTAVPTRLRTDPTRLRQILLNIVGNAVKFTDAGEVRIEVSFEEDDSQLVLDVVDTGVGIRAEHAEQLFRPFRQADTSTTRRFGGTGLGLALSRQLAQRLGGTLALEWSQEGAGSRFRLRLPVDPGTRVDGLCCDDEANTEARTRAARSCATAPDARVPVLDAHILVAEDGIDNARLIRHVLERAGARVTLAENGREALEVLGSVRDDPVTLVVMDMQMPVMDGFEATCELRRRGIVLPVLALTASSLAGDRERCLDAGCDAHHAKPFKPADLVRVCAELLDGRDGAASRPDADRAGPRAA